MSPLYYNLFVNKQPNNSTLNRSNHHSHLRLNTTTNTTSTTSGNKTDLLTRASTSTAGRRLTNVLMVTTTVRVIDRVHTDTADLRPLVALHSVLVVAATSLQHGLIHTTTTSDETDHSTATTHHTAFENLPALNSLLDTGRKTDVSHALVIGVTNDGGVVTRAASEGTTVTDLVLDVADDSTFGHFTERDDITDGNLSLLTAVHRLTSVHTFSSNEELLIELVMITRNYGFIERDYGFLKVTRARGAPRPES